VSSLGCRGRRHKRFGAQGLADCLEVQGAGRAQRPRDGLGCSGVGRRHQPSRPGYGEGGEVAEMHETGERGVNRRRCPCEPSKTTEMHVAPTSVAREEVSPGPPANDAADPGRRRPASGRHGQHRARRSHRHRSRLSPSDAPKPARRGEDRLRAVRCAVAATTATARGCPGQRSIRGVVPPRPDPGQQAVAGGTHPRVGQRVRQAPLVHRAAPAGGRVLPGAGPRDHHRASAGPPRVELLPLAGSPRPTPVTVQGVSAAAATRHRCAAGCASGRGCRCPARPPGRASQRPAGMAGYAGR
jgi:hypothetical protein